MASTSRQTTESKPPAWAVPAFQLAGQEAQDLYNSGAGGNVYTGSTVSPLSNTTMNGINQLAQAGANTNTAQSRGLFEGIGAGAVSNPFTSQLQQLAGGLRTPTVGSGSTTAQNVSGSVFNPAQNAASGLGGIASGLGGIASGRNGISTGTDYRDIYNRAQGPSSAEQNLQNYANGSNLTGEGNPFYQQALEQQLADTAAQVRSLSSGSGRLGSDVSNRQLADNLGNIRVNAMSNQFNQEQQNQLAANAQIDAARQANYGAQLGAVSGITGVQGQNLANRMGATGQQLGAQSDMAQLLAGIGNSRAGVAAGNADRNLQSQTGNVDRALQAQTGNADRAVNVNQLRGSLLGQAGSQYATGVGQAQDAASSIAGLDQQQFQNALTGAGASLQAGGLLDSQNQQQLNDAINQWYQTDNQDWTRLGMLEQAASGAAANYGTQNSTARQSNPLGVIGALGSIIPKK